MYLSQSDKFLYSLKGPDPASWNQVTWQLHVVWVSERERETGVRDQAWIVLTSEEGSGRAASSSGTMGGREESTPTQWRRGGWRENGLMEGGCKTLDDWDCVGWLQRNWDDGDREEVKQPPILDSLYRYNVSLCCLLLQLSHQLSDFLDVSHNGQCCNTVSSNSTTHGCLVFGLQFIPVWLMTKKWWCERKSCC